MMKRTFLYPEHFDKRTVASIFSLEMQNKTISIKNICFRDLPYVLKWYNNITDFKYATGIDRHVEMEHIEASYTDIAASSSEFFSGIYLKEENIIVGIVKGRVHIGPENAAWISMLLIDTEHQNKGYGSSVTDLILEFFSRKIGAKNVYLSVAEENIDGKGFWEKRGFRELQKLKGHFKTEGRECDVIVMHKRLS